MNITNAKIATAILNATIAGVNGDFRIEDAPSDAPYEGACLMLDQEEVFAGNFRMIHVYLCDDVPQEAMWMLDATDTETGDVNPLPLTAAALNAAIQWMLAGNGNTAQKIVAESILNPDRAWAIEAVKAGGLYMFIPDGHRFPDGSAIVYLDSHLPVEYIGAGPSYQLLQINNR